MQGLDREGIVVTINVTLYKNMYITYHLGCITHNDGLILVSI